VVPRAHAEEVLGLVAQVVDRERARIREIDGGMHIKADIDDALRKKGVIA
jgi:hypothetical protein